MNPNVVVTIHSGSGAVNGIADWCERWIPVMGANLVACHVASTCSWPVTWVSTSPSGGDGDEPWLMELAERLQGWSEVLRHEQMGVQAELLVGDLKQELLHSCRRSHASLLVLDGAGADAYGSSVIATLADNAARALGIPVVVIRGGAEGPSEGPIVVAYDGSPPSMVALREAARWAAGSQSRIVVATVLPMSPLEIELPDRMLRYRFESAQDDIAAGLSHHNLEAITESTVVATTHSEGTEIGLIAAEHHASVVIVGSRAGRGPFVRSVGREVIEYSPCPVVVVPEALLTSPWPQPQRETAAATSQLDLPSLDTNLQTVAAPSRVGGFAR